MSFIVRLNSSEVEQRPRNAQAGGSIPPLGNKRRSKERCKLNFLVYNMKKVWILFLTLWTLSVFGFSPLATEDGKPSPQLATLLERFDIQGDWPIIVQKTQEKWLRKKGTERWECKILPDPDPEKSFLLFKELGMIDERLPMKKEYDYAAFCGAPTFRALSRFASLKEIWNSGVRFKTIVILTGERTLDPKVDLEFDIVKNADVPLHTEKDLMIYLYNKLDLPEEMRKLPLVVADAKKSANETRAQSPDTFQAWRNTNPAPGSVLLITDQPFIPRMSTQAVNILKGFTVEGAGKGAKLEEYLKNPRAYAICLDEVARWIYVSYKENL